MKKFAALVVLAMALGLGACSSNQATTQPGCQASAVGASAPCYNGG